MGWETMMAYAAAMTVFAATPGPGILATVGRGLGAGFLPTLPLILGMILGDVIFLCLAVFGLALLAAKLGALFLVIKILGAGYLIFLGIKTITAPVSLNQVSGKQKGGGIRAFIGGLTISLSNPKVIVFYLAFLPAFIDLERLTFADTVKLSIVTAIVLLLVLSVFALSAARARALFTDAKARKRLNWSSGGVMIGAGFGVAAS